MMAKKRKINWKIVCTGIVCITALEAYALSQGIDGTIYTLVIGLVAAAIGVTIPNQKID